MKSKKSDALSVAGLRTATPPDLNERAEMPEPLVKPQTYERHKLLACKFCGKKIHDGLKAVRVRSYSLKVAYVESRCCRQIVKDKDGNALEIYRRWSLPIEEK